MSFGLAADYLGWKPSAGVYGRQFCDPVVQELMEKRRVQGIRLKRHTLEFVNKKKLKIAELPADSRTQKPLRYPSIPISDITYVQQEDGSTDPLVFCLILLGYNEESSHSVHVHAWRGRSLGVVSEFVARLNKCLTTRDHLQLVRQRESELLATREVQPSGLFGSEPLRRTPLLVNGPTGHLHTTTGSPGAAAAVASASRLPAELQSVTEELKRKLRDFSDNGSGAAPLLHPPRDYDTASRSHGNAMLARIEAPLRTGSRAPTGAVIRRTPPPSQPPPLPPPPGPVVDDNRNDSDSSECDCDEVEAATGNGAAEVWADPSRGFSTWRRRRMQQRNQRIAAASGVQAGGSASIVGWDGFEPPPPLPPPPSVEQRRQQQQQRHKGSTDSPISDRQYQSEWR